MTTVTLAVQVTRWAHDAQPGWVEFVLVDLAGRHHVFLEKVPVVTTEALTTLGPYPRSVALNCVVVARRQSSDGREAITVDTRQPYRIESTEGQWLFDVAPEQIDAGDA